MEAIQSDEDENSCEITISSVQFELFTDWGDIFRKIMGNLEEIMKEFESLLESLGNFEIFSEK